MCVCARPHPSVGEFYVACIYPCIYPFRIPVHPFVSAWMLYALPARAHACTGTPACMRCPRAHMLAQAHLHSHVHTRKTSLTHPQAHSRPELTSAMDHHRSERDGLAPAIDARNSAAGNPGGARPPTTAQAMMFVGIAPRPWPSASSQPQTSSAPNMIGNPGGAQAPTTAFKAVAGVGDAAHVD